MPEETFRWAVAGGVIIATLCILTMAVVAIMLYRLVSRVQVRVDDVTTRVEPLIDTVRRLADENGPKVQLFRDQRGRDIGQREGDFRCSRKIRLTVLPKLAAT